MSIICRIYFKEECFAFYRDLTKGNISPSEFVNSNTASAQSDLLKTLVHRLNDQYDAVPTEYKQFLNDLRKMSSVPGLLQVNSSEPLKYLKKFCTSELDLRHPTNMEKLSIVQNELPALWSSLLQILILEKEDKYLPSDVASIVLELIRMRREIYNNAIKRKEDGSDYFSWDDEEQHPLMFYPNWRVKKYPSNYNIKGSKGSTDSCNKEYNKTKDFVHGIFSVGCACPLNITLGFEIMKNQESANNMFRILSCLDIDLTSLKAVVYDHACGLNSFMMNREAREFKHVKTLVDGLHYKSHTGCSESFNSQLYKEALKPRVGNLNTAGREQINSKLQNMASSFRQMNYVSTIQMLKVYFGINNLESKGVI